MAIKRGWLNFAFEPAHIQHNIFSIAQKISVVKMFL